jgi:N-carbamoyl-L-amino-acid hydrolase
VNGARLEARLRALAAIGRNAHGGIDRVAYTEADRAGREHVTAIMRALALDVRVDAAANIIARRAGRDADALPLLAGSHIDSVPNGGIYDGALGSLAAIEVMATLAEHGVVTRHPLEVVIFQNEEGGLVGSRAMTGQLPERELERASVSGKTLGEGIAFLGGEPARLEHARRSQGAIAGYLELHVEQGRELERARADIGVVEGIVGIRHWEVTVTGEANHAGTTAMADRHDALLAAARFVEMVNRVVTGAPGRQVGTVGRIEALPGAPNVIPGQAVLTLELRDLDRATIQVLYERIAAEARRIGEESGTLFDFRETNVNVPAPMDERVRAAIAQAAATLGLVSMRMPSMAGHDAQSMAALGPAGMIFVPSVAGVSHDPRELTRARDVVNGANVLLLAVLDMDTWC